MWPRTLPPAQVIGTLAARVGAHDRPRQRIRMLGNALSTLPRCRAVRALGAFVDLLSPDFTSWSELAEKIVLDGEQAAKAA